MIVCSLVTKHSSLLSFLFLKVYTAKCTMSASNNCSFKGVLAKNHQQRHEHTNKATSLPFGYVLAKNTGICDRFFLEYPVSAHFRFGILYWPPPYMQYQAWHKFLKAEIEILRFFQQFFPQCRILINSDNKISPIV